MFLDVEVGVNRELLRCVVEGLIGTRNVNVDVARCFFVPPSFQVFLMVRY